jgi:CBS domain-containing protein
MLAVQDIMKTELFTLPADASAEEAAWALTRRHIGGAPVRDTDGRLIGVLTTGDLLDNNPPRPKHAFTGEVTVADLMSPHVFAIHGDQPAVSAARGMVEGNIHRVIVVDGERHAVGIVTSLDIVRAVAAGAFADPSAGPAPANEDMQASGTTAAPMLTIRDIMSNDLQTVAVESSAEDAAGLLKRRHIGSAPARDAEGNLVGVISRSDIVDPAPRAWIKGQATVGDLMTPDVISLYASDPAMAAIDEMCRHDVHRIVVLDEESQPAGIVSSMDVVRALVRGQRFELTA